MRIVVALTDRNTWGKGTTELRALTSVLLETHQRPRDVVFHEIMKVQDYSEVYVDGMGYIHYPVGAVVGSSTNLEVSDKLWNKFQDFEEEYYDLTIADD